MNKNETVLISKRYKYDWNIPFIYSKNQKNKIREFESKVSLKNRPYQECYLCKEKEFTKIAEKDKYWFYYPVVICKNCALVQTNPYYSTEEVSLFYSNYFRELYMWRKQSKKSSFEHNIGRGNKVISFIESKTKTSVKNKRVLDIWCGNGGILKAFANKWNKCVWLDLWSTYFNEWLQNNLVLKQMSLKTYLKDNNDSQFDIIIFSHNLEHLINPLEELELLHSIVHKDTIVYISVPWINYMKNDNYDFLNEFFQNAHKTQFSLKSLTNLMKIAWFELIYWDEEINTIFKLEKQKQEIIYEDYKDVLNAMIAIEQQYKKSYCKLMFIKSVYFILDKFWLRIIFLKFLNKIKLTKLLRKILLNGK